MNLKFLTSPVLTASGAVFCGTVMDALVKYVSADMDLVTLVFWRFTLATIFISIPFFLSGRRLPGWTATRFHAMRGLIHVTATYLFFFALGKLELAEVTVIGFTAALLILPFARLLLKEKVHPISAVAGLLGFVGVGVTAIGKDFGTEFTPDRMLGLASALGAACFYALSIVLLRMRAARDGGFAVAVYANLFPALFIAPVALTIGEPASWSEAPVLVFMGLFGMMIWVLMTSAYARAPAQRLAPVEYSALVWSAGIGLVVFHEVPNVSLWLGAALIIGACMIVLWQDHTDARKVPLAPD